MADVQIAYRFVQAVRKRRNEKPTSNLHPAQAVPFHRFLVRSPIENPSMAAGAIGGDLDTTKLIYQTPWSHPLPGSTNPLNQPTTQMDVPALPTMSTSLAPTNLQYGPQSSSSLTQASPPRSIPSAPVTSSFASATPVAPLVDSDPQKHVHLISSSTTASFSASQVIAETVLQEVVTISFSASISDVNLNGRPTPISTFLPTPNIKDADSASSSTDSWRPAAKAVGNVSSSQPTFGAPTSTAAIPSAPYPQQDLHLSLNPVSVVGCVLAGILALAVITFCIGWTFRSRRRLGDDEMAVL